MIDSFVITAVKTGLQNFTKSVIRKPIAGLNTRKKLKYYVMVNVSLFHQNECS